MAVYLTKSMLSKFNKARYPLNCNNEDEASSSSSSDHWQKLMADW